MTDTLSAVIKRENCVYTSCYCEENIWKLCEQIKNIKPECLENCFVIFVSNHSKQVPIWFQKSGHVEDDYLCVWDYHVFMIEKSSNGTLVFDFDTVLDFPVPFEIYVAKALKPEFNRHYERLFRVIPSNTYLTCFASDRSHMKRKDGSYMQEPPSYSPICTEGILIFLFINKLKL
ncbi:hypothetical protein O3M35_010036 [Rhynocoris fuscipes]|uniref:Protein N-terminal glutamine amidohydrolase n=1 Tax=Rhynocoris fuscipes TaxID=488301 RepID=A0AAW1CYF0_9HEMI